MCRTCEIRNRLGVSNKDSRLLERNKCMCTCRLGAPRDVGNCVWGAFYGTAGMTRCNMQMEAEKKMVKLFTTKREFPTFRTCRAATGVTSETRGRRCGSSGG